MITDEEEEALYAHKDFGSIPEMWEADFDKIEAADMAWVRFSEYHFRIENLVDYWPTRGKWYVPFLDFKHPHLYERGLGADSAIEAVLKIKATPEYLKYQEGVE